jgi:poly-beta-1,6-N-acetyl-D-glucosamine synthase
MQPLLKEVFWVGVAILVYTYVLYPLAVWMLASLRPERAGFGAQSVPPAFSLILVLHNEAARIKGRLDELVALIRSIGRPAELIAVTDGCTDGTAELARSHESPLVRVLELSEKVGKAHALTRGCEAAKGAILVFADARQRWASDSVQRLLENFDRLEVGAVSGEVLVDAAPGVLAGVGLYWRYETWLRRNEGRLHSTVGVTGPICAVRRELFRPIPRGVVLDDVYWPLQVVMQGRRVVYDRRAIAYDRLPKYPHGEFRRKVRTLTGNFQLAATLPEALLPWRNPIWLQFVSHKVLRLVIPWMMIATFLASGLLDGSLYRAAFVGQILFYGLALAALADTRLSGWRVAAAPASFVVLNAAAWLAFWMWIWGRADRTWKKVAFDAPLPPD